MNSDMEITSLGLSYSDMLTSKEEITLEELRLTTMDARDDLSEDQLSALRDTFSKKTYTILGKGKNREGFGFTENAMKNVVKHFNETKEDPDLHNFYRDHDYKHIDSLLGRVVKMWFDDKNKRVKATALIDTRHPLGNRLDMFKNLSGTFLHGKKLCSMCGQKFGSCDHVGKDVYPESDIAYSMEHSLVTLSADPSAKMDSLSSSFASHFPEYADAFTLTSLGDNDGEDEEIKPPTTPTTVSKEEEELKKKLEEEKRLEAEKKAQRDADLASLKDTIELLKKSIDAGLL